jgi:outer membrane protein TolC
LENLKKAEEKQKEAEENTRATINKIQLNIDESAKEMTSKNAEHHKQKQELEVGAFACILG